MGASNIGIKLPGVLSQSQVEVRMEEVRMQELEMNGYRHGYSGDWQTIPEIKFHTHEIFENAELASDNCLEYAKKWEYAIAVKFLDNEKNEQWMVAGWAAE